jgi:hypothetical protein
MGILRWLGEVGRWNGEPAQSMNQVDHHRNRKRNRDRDRKTGPPAAAAANLEAEGALGEPAISRISGDDPQIAQISAEKRNGCQMATMNRFGHHEGHEEHEGMVVHRSPSLSGPTNGTTRRGSGKPGGRRVTRGACDQQDKRKDPQIAQISAEKRTGSHMETIIRVDPHEATVRGGGEMREPRNTRHRSLKGGSAPISSQRMSPHSCPVKTNHPPSTCGDNLLSAARRDNKLMPAGW